MQKKFLNTAHTVKVNDDIEFVLTDITDSVACKKNTVVCKAEIVRLKFVISFELSEDYIYNEIYHYNEELDYEEYNDLALLEEIDSTMNIYKQVRELLKS